jgi:hypothetical protein
MYAQKTEGTIRGSVTDQSGAVVANASVTATNLGTGATRSATSTATGDYVIPDLPPGTYKVTVKAASFKEGVVNNVELHISSQTLVNVKLEVGGATEVMEVNANALQVQTDSAALGEVIDATQVKELPLNGRSFVQLTQLAPGVSAANNYDAKDKGLQGGVDFSVNGNPNTNNLFLIDGANNNDTGSNRTILLYPSIEAIAEFKMLRNSYSAEYGQASGAVITVLTKGGTNDWHGSALYSGRNSALNAYEYFARQINQKNFLQRNDFAGSIGGPIKKDKLFVFYSEEINKEKRGIVRTTCVPTAAEQAGDFSQGVSCGANVPNIPAAYQDPSNPLKIANPDPAGTLLISKYPLPNLTTPVAGNNWGMSENSKLNFREENVRADFNVTKANSLMFRYTQDTWTNPAPTGGQYWGDDIFPTLTSSWAQPSKMIIGKWTSQIGTTMVNNAEFSYSNNRINIGVGGSNPGLQQQISDAIPSLWPNSLKEAPASTPTIWGGFSPYCSACGNYWVIAPWNNSLDIYSARDDASKVIGNHTLKFGALIDWSGKNEVNSASSTERPTFGTADWDTNVPTGNPLANVLIPGAVWGFSEPSTNLVDHLRWRDYEFYLDDTWKIRRNVTLELGVRYSLLYTPYNPDDLATSFQPWLYDPTKPNTDACNGLWTVPGTDPCGAANSQFGTSFSKAAYGPNRYLVNQNHHQFAPRVGIAWDPWGDGNWAIRFGIGQFFQRERVSGPYYSITNNAPFVINANASKALGAPTPATLSGSASPSGGRSPDSLTPNSWQWNFSVEHSFTKDTVLQVGYVGNRGIHLTSNYDINAVSSAASTNCTYGGVNYGTVPSTLCAAFLNANSSPNVNSLRPYSNFGQLGYWTHGGDSSYHALQVLFKSQYKRSQVTAAYTWSHSIADVLLDNSDGGVGISSFTDPTRPYLDRGNSAINRPHIFVANFTYFLPELTNSAPITRGVLGGWEVGAIVTEASGNSQTMYQAGISENQSLLAATAVNKGALGTQYGSGGLFNMLRPLVTGQSCSSGRTGEYLYNPNAFTMVGYQIGTIPGNVEPRGYCAGPNLNNIDFSVDKNWKLSERFKLQFRMDFFDLFNHANFVGNTGSNTPIGGSTINCGPADANGQYQSCSPTNNVISNQNYVQDFGKATQTNTKAGRELQYTLKLTF